MANTSKNSEPASITKADVTSNVDSQKSVGLTNGILRLTYYEYFTGFYQSIYCLW